MADIIQVAEQLNSEVTRLNNERSKLEGMLESAKTNYEKAVKAYEVKYGVKLTEETLQQEYNTVFAKTKGAILDLQEQIESIKRGDYKNDSEAVEYDLEPDVEPIRAEVKPEPEKKKRGRKPKAEQPVVEEKVEAPVEAPVVEAEPEIPAGPFTMNTDFGGFGVEEQPVVKVEEPKKNTISKKSDRKPLSAADLSAAVAASENIKQTPVTMPVVEEDDEVDISDLNIGNIPFGENPNMSFGSFADLGVEPKKEEPVNNDDSFGGFNFGGFGNVVEEKKEEPQMPNEDVSFGGFGGFGGFADLGVEPQQEAKSEEPKQAEELSWGAGFDFGNSNDFSGFGGFDGFKFGE